ncbi:MAG: histidine kinase [Chitinophagaceae bacterium]|nr:MAG: histidine kinase [Chitinophagaceae bacterium]
MRCAWGPVLRISPNVRAAVPNGGARVGPEKGGVGPEKRSPQRPASVFCRMLSAPRQWTLRQKDRAAEAVFLGLLSVVIPLSIGFQIFPRFSWTLSLVLVNCLQVPAIVLLYRWYLPQTLLRRRFALFFLLLPVYILVYELNVRAVSLLLQQLPFIPQQYRYNLSLGHPGSVPPLFVQNLDYTLLILLAATGFVYIREWFRRQTELERLQADKWRLELEGLKAQVQPHFFFNTLNNLYALSLQGSPRTPVMIAHLSGIMRYVLYEAQSTQVPLSKEIAFLQSFIDLEKIRHSNEDDIRFAVQGQPEGRLIEPLLLLPLVENCFKHSLQQRIPGNRVELLLQVTEGELVFQTSNLKAAPAAPSGPGGIGLQNVRKRLELLYPGRHSLDVLDESGRFTVTLTLQW